jgi:predicted Fe-Mo cluster-binding NifX family protein
MFLVFDIKDKEIANVEKRINSFTMHKQGGHEHNPNHEHHHNNHNGRHEGILNGLKDCQYLICSSAGPGLISELTSNKIELMLTDEIEGEIAVKKLISGDLVSDPNKSCNEHPH